MKKIVILLLVLSTIIAAVAFGYFRQSAKKEHDNAEYVSNNNSEDIEVASERVDFSGKSLYTNEVYKISFAYPQEWALKAVDGSTNGLIATCSQKNDFLNISVLEGKDTSIETMVLSEVYQKGQPFGQKPRIYSKRMNGMDAIIIEASPDQNKAFKNQSVCIIKFPKPVVASSKSYNYLRIHSTKDTVGTIAKTVRRID